MQCLLIYGATPGMHGTENIEFPDLSAGELEIYARQRAADLGLCIPQAFLPDVLENLAGLQAHAAILKAALNGAVPPTSGSPPS